MSRDELYQAAKRKGLALSEDAVEDSLRKLVQQGEVVEWAVGFFRSRIAETVRVLRLARQRLWSQDDLFEAALLVEDIRVEFRQRYQPNRKTVLIADALPNEVPAEIARAFREAIGFETVSKFQSEAIEQVYLAAHRGNPNNLSFMVAGDTGAGKTEAFFFPILLDIACEPPDVRQRRGVRAVLVYPRIRLARNQMGRLLRYTDHFFKAGGPRIIFGIQNGDVPSSRAYISQKKWEVEERNGCGWYRVELLETCVECDRGHYWVAENDPEIDSGCPRLVCDNCQHTIDTLYITQTSLERNAPDVLIITDVSLSQWLAREKYSHLWGLWQGDLITVSPRFLVLDEVHLYEQLKGAHIARLIKRFQARVQLAYRQEGRPNHYPIVIGVSATLHNERRFLSKLLDVDPQDRRYTEQLKVIKPLKVDLERTEGRERYIFIYPRSLSPTPRNPKYRVNDQAAAIQIVMAAMHNLKTDVEWRGLAFFDSINDLRQFRHNYDADRSLEGIDIDSSGREIPPANQDQLWRIRTDRQKIDRGRLVRSTNVCGSTCEERIRTATLNECPHFRAGDCWIFAKTHGWNEPLRVANSVYAGASSQLDEKDLIPTSPSLEVGYDDEAIQLVYQHKAPASAASFIQRRGRAGRNPNDSPIIITLLWPYRRDDAFYFIHPEALYDPAFDDVPLNAGNFNVQRTHSLLAFFDLLACLRRQNIDGIRDDTRIIDFTVAGWYDFSPGDDVVQSYSWLPDPKRLGQRRVVIKHKGTKENIWISGKPIEQGMVREEQGKLIVKGWLAMDKGLTAQILRPSWDKLNVHSLFSNYLGLSDIVSRPFQKHRTYPFLIPHGATLPSQLLRLFGNKAWHSSNDGIEPSNWLKTYRYIDWMLQGSEEATTLTVHYPNPELARSEPESGQDERTVEVTFGLSELLPGNVSYRLRDPLTIHWTPIPLDGVSTFLYPEEDVLDESGNVVGRRQVSTYLPVLEDITSKPDSIFGVPRYLDAQFPSLPFMTLKRLRVETFGPPNRQYSPKWVFVHNPDNPKEGRVVDRRRPGGTDLTKAFRISRRSSARASSVIIPYVAASRRVLQRQLLSPLDTLFGGIDGYLEEGTGMLGYTRVFYEMQIDIKAIKHEQSLTLRRFFYPPEPLLDEAGRPKPILVGYNVETQGICFQINPDLVAQAVEAILADKDLRLRLRRNFSVYRMAPSAAEWEVFIQTHLDRVAVAVDYWLHEVVPQSQGEPRLLVQEMDRDALLTYYGTNRIVKSEEVDDFREFLMRVDGFFASLNNTLEVAFKETRQFHEFVTSVVLHSLSVLLKNLIARLGGVSSEDLVAYADLPVLDQVDRSIDPRILIMDTVEGGSGGIAQAFERLDLTDSEGSLWWTLQTELGSCPIGNGEALVRTVLTQATAQQIRDVQVEAAPEALTNLLDNLGVVSPGSESLQMLGRTLFKRIEVSGQSINPTLILQELFTVQEKLDASLSGPLTRELTIRRAITGLDSGHHPQISELRKALKIGGAAENDLDYELALQLLTLYNSGCDDGCPVCLSANSDIEHYHLAPLLNSRHALTKLRQVLLSNIPQNDCLVALADTLLSKEAVQVKANPGSLGNRLDTSLGLGTVIQVDETGQVWGASTTVINADHAKDFIMNGTWEHRWSSPEDLPYETPQGKRIRSGKEYKVAIMLEEADIAFEYEPRLPYRDETGRTVNIHPSFYLFERGLYVECWGREGAEYIESRVHKKKVYDELAAQRGVRVLYLESEDMENMLFIEKIQARIRDDRME
ncbi:MAG: DEAD/DEAH box helicase [Ktedonobacteraceae bacterium]